MYFISYLNLQIYIFYTYKLKHNENIIILNILLTFIFSNESSITVIVSVFFHAYIMKQMIYSKYLKSRVQQIMMMMMMIGINFNLELIKKIEYLKEELSNRIWFIVLTFLK